MKNYKITILARISLVCLLLSAAIWGRMALSDTDPDKVARAEIEEFLSRRLTDGRDTAFDFCADFGQKHPEGGFVKTLILILNENVGIKFPLEKEESQWSPETWHTFRIIERALALLGYVGTNDAVDTIIKFIDHDYFKLRHVAIESLGYTKNRRAYAILVEIAKKREAELPALEKISEENAKPIELAFKDAWYPISAMRRLNFLESKEYTQQWVERLRTKYRQLPRCPAMIADIESALKNIDESLEEDRKKK